MFALRVTYLTGRVYSATYDDGDLKSEPEWPPHPSRLLYALVAAWGDGGAEPELRPALEWLERQQYPDVHAGQLTMRKNVQAFVPVNDSARLPDQRPRKGRTFPSGTLSHPDVYFVWPAEPDPQVRHALQELLLRTSSLGHSSSLVAAEISETIPVEARTVWKARRDGHLRMRVPYAGRMAELERRYIRFQAEPVKMNRPDRGKTVRYGPVTSDTSPVLRGCFDRMVVLRRVSGQKASLRSTLSLTSALRGALMKLAPQPVPGYLSGHAPESTRENPVPTQDPHLALAPLAFVGSDYATGDVQGVAVLLPASLASAERTLCWDVLSRVRTLNMPWGWWEVTITDAEETRVNLLPEAWTRRAATWSTVTPFVFDRYPKDPYGEEAKQVVTLALRRIGLPEPVDIELHYNPWHRGVPRASLFPPALAREGKPQRYHSHVRIRFAAPVEGPVVAGAGRFYGYGLFRPHPERNAE
jgi:CRISPR-associated protein Csb2